jgi:hypothetical protein
MFNDYTSIGSPSHQESPYEFKVHAIEAAWKFDPIVFWLDSSMVRVGDLTIAEEIIKTEGYLFQEAGHYVRDWTQDETLKYFGLTRQTDYLMFSAGMLGLNKNNELAVRWFEKWKQSALDGHFRGPWSSHRHDMSCGSIIAEQLGMKYKRGGSLMAYLGPGYAEPEKNIIFTCQGMA